MNRKTRLVWMIVLSLLLVLGAVSASRAFAHMGKSQMPDDIVVQPSENGSATDMTDALALVQTGDQSSWADTVEELVTLVDPSGNSVITLRKDLAHGKALELPYSCTLDLAGYSITTNPEQGPGLQILAAGSENKTTVLKNGTVCSFSDGLQVMEGAVVLSGVTLETTKGACLALYDPNEAYRDINRVENSWLISASGACIGFQARAEDFSKTCLTVANSSLISHKKNGGQVVDTASSVSVPGAIELAEGAKLYTYAEKACPEGYVFLGKTAFKEHDVTVTAGPNTWEGMNMWTTESNKKVLNILMIGNSFCYSYVDELYGMAAELGYELNITNLYRGGCSIKSHYKWLQDPAEGADKCEYFITGSLGRYKHPTITTLAEALEYAHWDVISCQQHFDVARTLDYAAGWESCMPEAADMYTYLKTRYPDAKLYWQQTWAYAVGYQHPDNRGQAYDINRKNGDVPDVSIQTRQHEVIRSVSRALCAENSVALIPTGDAWHLARGALGDTLTKPDCCHDSDVGGGQYLNACVWLEVLLGESCIGNTWRPADYGLMENRIAALQECAHEAVAAVYGPEYAK